MPVVGLAEIRRRPSRSGDHRTGSRISSPRSAANTNVPSPANTNTPYRPRNVPKRSFGGRIVNNPRMPAPVKHVALSIPRVARFLPGLAWVPLGLELIEMAIPAPRQKAWVVPQGHGWYPGPTCRTDISWWMTYAGITTTCAAGLAAGTALSPTVTQGQPGTIPAGRRTISFGNGYQVQPSMDWRHDPGKYWHRDVATDPAPAPRFARGLPVPDPWLVPSPLPSVIPSVVPIIGPIQPMPSPVPFTRIPAMRPGPRPSQVTERGPAARPVERPLPRPRPRVRKRPPRGTREIKTFGPPQLGKNPVPKGLLGLVGLATEGLDAIGALHKALPKHLHSKGRLSVKDKMRDLWDHWDQVDPQKALEEFAKMNLEDIAWAKVGKGMKGFGRGPWDGPNKEVNDALWRKAREREDEARRERERQRLWG